MKTPWPLWCKTEGGPGGKAARRVSGIVSDFCEEFWIAVQIGLYGICEVFTLEEMPLVSSSASTDAWESLL